MWTDAVESQELEVDSRFSFHGALTFTDEEREAFFAELRERPDDKSLRHILVRLFIPMALKLYSRHTWKHPTLERSEVLSEAMHALVLACSRFDPLRGLEPSTYLWETITRHLQSHCHSKSQQVVRLTRDNEIALRKLADADPDWASTPASLERAAAAAGVYPATAHNLRNAATGGEVSANAIGDGEDGSWEDSIVRMVQRDPSQVLYEIDVTTCDKELLPVMVRRALRWVQIALPGGKQVRRMVLLRLAGKTLAEAGELMGFSRQYANKLERKAIGGIAWYFHRHCAYLLTQEQLRVLDDPDSKIHREMRLFEGAVLQTPAGKLLRKTLVS